MKNVILSFLLGMGTLAWADSPSMICEEGVARIAVRGDAWKRVEFYSVSGEPIYFLTKSMRTLGVLQRQDSVKRMKVHFSRKHCQTNESDVGDFSCLQNEPIRIDLEYQNARGTHLRSLELEGMSVVSDAKENHLWANYKLALLFRSAQRAVAVNDRLLYRCHFRSPK